MTSKPNPKDLEHEIKFLQNELEKHKEREKALKQSQEKLIQIIESVPIPTFVIDNDHVVTHYNKAMENLTGIRADKIVGTRNQWQAFYAEARLVMADFIVDQASEEEIAACYKDKYRPSDVKRGAYEAEDFFPVLGDNGKWLFFTAAPLKDSEGRNIGAVETLQDISERKRTEKALVESERHLRTLLDFAPYSIVVFTLDGLVTYLNPAFSETFGWTFKELRGKRIPYVPPDLKQEVSQNIRKLFEEKVILRYETRRLTKDGRILDIVMRGAVYSDSSGNPAGELVILRDVTQEKRIERNNKAMLRTSMALPEYPELYELIDYVSGVIKELMDTEGGVVILLDEGRQELFFLGAAYDDSATQKRVKEIRFGVDELVAGRVIKTGKPILINDTTEDADLHLERDKKLGYQTKNLLLVPLRSHERVIGVLCAINKKAGVFEETDTDLLSMLGGNVALSIENARFSEELKKAYMEVTSLNRTKDKVINHLSHELRTPIAVLNTSLILLVKRMQGIPQDSWKPTLDRARRNLDRLLEMQYQIDDIMRDKTYTSYGILYRLLEASKDELETLVAEQIGEGSIVDRIKTRIEDEFGLKELIPEKIQLDRFVKDRLVSLRTLFSHRQIDIADRLESTPPVYVPLEALAKVFDGLLKNAIENTPEEGRIEITVKKKNAGTQLVVRDYGVGITKENQSRIFEGFFATQEALDYSSKKPFDFNAGGKGADLLRMRVFSERYNFKLEMASERCRLLPKDSDICPGRISACPKCQTGQGCHQSGATSFTLYFPPPP